ncbi:tRNA (mnm(5)s(2)U34)-methyltransferase [Paenisporosarcina cavernae]|uniref:16S rRNA (Cytosine(1402)-N(4))-methyltransferase n=1 Tax=Paenisporosarcina cavernae TaxID=2320858 RepID=A0A385YTR9_9BACL|nr:class I SAM-dependent methyltransferase [Paenisporosarcina cavernae]AYC29901.1 16S rRNA (cytosine(1402)-N(4))-methyltransferase [Paenisporosarcina cavernae]
MQTVIQFARNILEEIVLTGDTVIDATIGNGHDTLFLSTLVGQQGTVWGFDIQEKAIQETSSRLKDFTGDLHLIHNSHESIDSYIEGEVKAVMFNLGYLPGSDHETITRAPSTIQALKKSMQLLQKGGRITIVLYDGHDGGLEETNEVIKFCEQLNQREFHVLKYQFINQQNHPPFLLALEKR